jgi:hypothetical protein
MLKLFIKNNLKCYNSSMNKINLSHKKAFLLITFSGFPVILFFLWLQQTGQTQTNLNNFVAILSGFIFLLSSIISFKYYKKIGDRGGVSSAIFWTGVSSLLFFLGSIVWTYYNFIEKIELPYPSVADIFYVSMAIAYAIAIGSLLQIYKTSTSLKTWIVSIAVFILLTSVMFFYVGQPEISGELSFWENFFNFAFALSDSIYVGAGVALLIIAGGKIYKGIMVWVLGMFLITIADIVFSYRSATGELWNGDIADQIYTLSAIIFTYAIILLAKMTEQNKINI